VGDESTLLVLLVLEYKSEETVQAVFTVKLHPVRRVCHVACRDEDWFMLTDAALFSQLALPPNGILRKTFHVPDIILGLLCSEEGLFVTTEATMIV
jgi:hypothetical protein